MRRFRIIRRNKTRITFFDLSEMGQKVISGFISSDYNLFRIQLTKVFPWSKEWGVVNTAFNHTQNECSINELANYKQVFERQFNQPGIEFLKSELKQIYGIDFIVMEFITPAVDSRIYNLIFATSLENRLMIGTFNCTINHLEEWKPLAGEILNSITLK